MLKRMKATWLDNSHDETKANHRTAACSSLIRPTLRLIRYGLSTLASAGLGLNAN